MVEVIGYIICTKYKEHTMYTLISALAKEKIGDERWANVDISNVSLATLISTYSRVIAILSNPFYPNNISFDLINLPPGIDGETITFSQFLTSLGNAALMTSSTVPILNPVYAQYNDMFKAGYSITPINKTAAVDSQLPLSDKTWLMLTRPNTDYNLFYNSCLVSVNGFYHLTDHDVNGVYVIDGTKSMLISKQNEIGMHCFNDIGKLTFIPITPGMIYKQNSLEKFSDEAHINIGQDVSNKTIMLVLGGYLHALDDKTVIRTSDNGVAVIFNNLPLLERYFESKKYIDLSSLPLDHTVRNLDQIGVQQFYSDENILAYLTLSQSFFVLIDNTEIFVEREPVQKTPFPNMFISHTKPIYPLVVGYGKVANYWNVYEDGQWSLTCKDSERSNFYFNTLNVAIQQTVTSQELSTKPSYQSHAYFLKIGTDLI